MKKARFVALMTAGLVVGSLVVPASASANGWGGTSGYIGNERVSISSNSWGSSGYIGNKRVSLSSNSWGSRP